MLIAQCFLKRKKTRVDKDDVSSSNNEEQYGTGDKNFFEKGTVRLIKKKQERKKGEMSDLLKGKKEERL